MYLCGGADTGPVDGSTSISYYFCKYSSVTYNHLDYDFKTTTTWGFDYKVESTLIRVNMDLRFS